MQLLDARVAKFFTVTRQEVELEALANDSGILVVLADYVQFFLLWTHKNGPACSNGARQELDYIFVSRQLATGMQDIAGGVHDYPESWEMSDHSPVAVTLNLD